MNKLKKVLILLTILIILVVLSIIAIIIKNKASKEGIGEYITAEDLKETENDNDTNSIEKNRKDYFIIYSCVEKYLENINIENPNFYGRDDNNNYVKIVEDNDIKTYILDLLSSSYIEKNNITIQNLYDNVKTTKDFLLFAPIEMKLIHDADVKTYYIHGIAESQDQYNVVMELHLAVNLDENNNTFSIEVLKDANDLNSIKEISNIEENDNNGIFVEEATEKEIVLNYIDSYKRAVLGVPEWAYNNILDEEYKNKRFQNASAFKEYVEKNKEQIIGIRATSYKIEENSDSTRYVIIDQNKNSYIFNEKEILDYKVILDTYTIDLPEFLEKYETADEQQKVALNIDKFFQAINAGDYRYSYNCLADSFKSNYFKTQEEFESYVKQNFYANNSVKYKEFGTQGDLYTYSVILTDKETNNQTTKTFIIQLGEGTEFKLSFNR